MEHWEALKFKHEMNKALKRGSSFDLLFTSPGFAERFAAFQKTKIGQIWMKSSEGWDYRIWQQS